MGQNRTTQRYHEVCWCASPVYIENLQVQDIKQELGFQIYTNLHLESLGIAEYWYHPAGENRGSGIYGLRAGLFAKRSGQRRGLPDWLNFERKLAIELKLPKGAVSDDQWRWLAHFKQLGWYCEVIRSFERFKQVVESV